MEHNSPISLLPSSPRWNFHQPHTGKMPQIASMSEFTWPVLFLYPGAGQSDFIEHFASTEMIAERLAEIFPEEGPSMPWDYNNEYKCSNLAVYFEVHDSGAGGAVHPESVMRLNDMGSAMRFFENARGLRGDDGLAAQEKSRDQERKGLRLLRKGWEITKGKWAQPDLCNVVQVHPGALLEQVLTDKRAVVPNFVFTFMVFPNEHPSHAAFLKERKVLGLINPSI